jgi:hypothetical protein
MKLAIVRNNKIISHGHYRTLFPNTSFASTGPNEEFLKNNNLQKIVSVKSYDRSTHYIQNSAPYLEDGVVYDVVVMEKNASLLSLDQKEQEERVRNRRNSMISQTDFYALSDVTMPEEISAYRQALRDITTHANFPFLNEEDWPKHPFESELDPLTGVIIDSAI